VTHSAPVRKRFINIKVTQKVSERKFYQKKIASQVADVEETMAMKIVKIGQNPS
jgi:hypothetical protein